MDESRGDGRTAEGESGVAAAVAGGGAVGAVARRGQRAVRRDEATARSVTRKIGGRVKQQLTGAGMGVAAPSKSGVAGKKRTTACGERVMATAEVRTVMRWMAGGRVKQVLRQAWGTAGATVWGGECQGGRPGDALDGGSVGWVGCCSHWRCVPVPRGTYIRGIYRIYVRIYHIRMYIRIYVRIYV